MEQNTLMAILTLAIAAVMAVTIVSFFVWLSRTAPKARPRQVASPREPLWSVKTTSYRPSKIPDTPPKEDAVPDRRSIRINVSWTSTGEEDDVEINKAIAHHERTLQLAIASINLRTRPAVSSNEGSRQCFTRDDRLAIGDFLDWACDTVKGFDLGEFSITDIVNEYQEMVRSAQAKPPSGGGGNS
jgi:hypothetical protein